MQCCFFQLAWGHPKVFKYHHQKHQITESKFFAPSLKRALKLDNDVLEMLLDFNKRISFRYKKMLPFCDLTASLSSTNQLKNLEAKDIKISEQYLRQVIAITEKAEVVLDLKWNLDLSGNQSLRIPINQEMENLKTNRNLLSSCLQKIELQQVIESNDKGFHSVHKQFAKSLLSFLVWTEKNPYLQLTTDHEIAKNTFDTIFNFFWNESAFLTKHDEILLKATYQLWSSMYELLPSIRQQALDGHSILFENLNPHNAAFFAWLEAKEVGHLGARPLPLLHADTHTDLLHVYHHLDSDIMQDLTLEQAVDLLLLLKIKDEQDVESKNPIDLELLNVLSEKQKNALRPYFKQLNKEMFQKFLLHAMKQNVKFIGQPMVASMASGIVSDFIFSLPPWSQKKSFSPIQADGTAKSSTGHIIKKVMEDFMSEEQVEVLSFQSDSDAPAIFEHHNQNNLPLLTKPIKEVHYYIDPALAEINSYESTTAKGRYQTVTADYALPYQSVTPYFRSIKPLNQRFILDIDLDVFASDGRTNVVNMDHWNGPTQLIARIDKFENKAMPYSYERTPYLQKLRLQFDQFEHQDLKQLKNAEIVVSSTEHQLVKVRMEQFFSKLEKSKNDGYIPAIITITDSTVLSRTNAKDYFKSFASSIEYVDSNFTPVPFVFLINYYARVKLREIYQTKLGE